MVTRGYKGLQGVASGDRDLQGITRDYKAVTGVYKRLQGETGN